MIFAFPSSVTFYIANICQGDPGRLDIDGTGINFIGDNEFSSASHPLVLIMPINDSSIVVETLAEEIVIGFLYVILQLMFHGGHINDVVQQVAHILQVFSWDVRGAYPGNFQQVLVKFDSIIIFQNFDQKTILDIKPKWKSQDIAEGGNGPIASIPWALPGPLKIEGDFDLAALDEDGIKAHNVCSLLGV